MMIDCLTIHFTLVMLTKCIYHIVRSTVSSTRTMRNLELFSPQ
uniref:Uncharacterized protein n=1 Tax=Setaria italica TaxID=4555 RepID=K4AN57_SETIT